MDASNIFGLFDFEEEKSDTGRLEQSTTFPFIFINLFTKIVLQAELLNSRADNTLKGLNSTLDIPKLKHLNKMLSTVKAYELISQFDFQDNSHVEALLKSDLQEFSTACKSILDTLAQYEEYEKCTFIKELLDFVNFYQNKLPY